LGREVGKVKQSKGDQVIIVTTNEESLSYGQIVKIYGGENLKSTTQGLQMLEVSQHLRRYLNYRTLKVRCEQ
jgi:hypothetical protein